MSARRRAAPCLVALLVIACVLGRGTSAARGQDKPADDIPLSATFITEGVLPATEIEAGFGFISSDVQRQYQYGFTSLQYAWGTTLGLKLVVPFAVIEPRDGGPTVAGPGDVQLLAKSAPLGSHAHLFALGGALKLTLPSGSEPRGLGGTLALAPGLLAGKAWRVGDRILALQADAFYSWQLDRPERIETESGSSSPDRDQRLTANLTIAHAPIRWLTGILEVNTTTVIAGDPELRGRVQAYLTPGVSLEPAGWSFRAGVQVPLTRARELDYNVIFLATKGF